VVLCLGVVGLSTSGPLARLATSPPLTIAFWRLTFSLAIVAAALAWTEEWRALRTVSRRDLGLAAAAGAALALHFWSWIASLGLTSVAASVVLVNLHPLIIVTGSAWLLGERATRAEGLGLVLAMVGGVIVAVGEVAPDGARPSSVVGNLLAIVGALTVGIYYVVGRHLRARLPLWSYVGLVYGACWLVVLLLVVLTNAPARPTSAGDWPLFLAIAAGPMLLGHTGFNWALRYVPAYVVSLVILGEPVGAAVLAWAVPAIGEVPSPSTLLGGAILLCGLAVAARGQRIPAG
jgi:drug/metabolite transporter (DMT)-like permease